MISFISKTFPIDFIYFFLYFVSLQSSSLTTSTEAQQPSATRKPIGHGSFAATHRRSGESPLPPGETTTRRGVRPQGLIRPLPDVPLFSDPILVHSGVEEEGDNPTVRHHSSTPVLAPAKGTVKKTVQYERVAEPAKVLPLVSAPTSRSGALPKPSPLGGDVLHADVSVPAAVADLMDSRMETTALGEIVHRQRVRQKEEVEEEMEERDRFLIEALPIEPVVEKVKQPRKPVDPTKKQHFKAVRPYHGTLGLPTEVELDTVPPVMEKQWSSTRRAMNSIPRGQSW